MTVKDALRRVHPRLVRPALRQAVVDEELTLHPCVMERTGHELEDARRRAKRELVALYAVAGLALLAGVSLRARVVETEPEAMRQQPAALPELVAIGDMQPEPLVGGDVLTVGDHTFVEVGPEASTLLAAPGETRMARLSHYWPPLGGPNCADFRGGQCMSDMASGLPWYVWVGRAAACPVELPFWTTITLPGGEIFVCLDRGSKIITTEAGELWIDLLLERAPVPHGAVVPVTVRRPYWLAADEEATR